MIRVINNWYIDADSYGYVIQEYVENSKSKNKYRNYRYYSTLREALQGVIEMSTRQIIAEDGNTLQEALKRVTELYEKLDDDLKEILGR